MRRLLNFSWLISDDIVRGVLSLVVLAFVARHLGPGGYGALTYIFSVVGLFVPLAAMGLDIIIMRKLAAGEDEAGRTLGTALVIRFVGALVAIAATLGFLAISGGPEGVTLGLVAIAVLALPIQAMAAFDGYLKATENVAWLGLPRIAIRCVIAATTIGFVATGATLPVFVGLRVAEAGLIALAATVAYAIISGQFRFTADMAQLKSLLGDGMPMLLSSLAVILYMRIDQVMLGQLTSGEELGQYGVAVRVSEAVFFIPMALQAAFYPSLVRTWKEAPDHWLDELQHYFDITVLAMLGLAIVVTLFATFALTLVVGASYNPAIPMIWVLSIGTPFVGIGVARSTYLTIQGSMWTITLATSLGAIVNVGLNFCLIPLWGGIGAAWATVISYWLVAHGTCLLVPWLRPIGRLLTLALDPIGASRRTYARWHNQQQSRAAA